ncbi:MFS transporter, partial [Ornithinibacter sp.]|uniref:MFS transporter n=1 Tax=Ornithinibacter sp. TaxID=2862748 RepID=UPI002CBE07F1
LYGISSIPGEGTFFSSKVIIPGTLGLVMVAGFVVWSFRPAHPLLDLRLFKNRNLTVSTITMFLFAAAFFGGLLLVPTYFQQVRGESALSAGWLMAVQGLGAMITMPIAGSLVDKLPVGRIVPFGLAAIVGGMFALTQVTATTSYWYILPVLFVMGLGMGGTMMPLMTSALKTLTSHEVARGSTLLNISQQIASSIGVAIMSVVLTNGLNNDPLLKASRAFGEASNGVTDPGQLGTIAARFPEVAALLARGQEALMAAVDEAMASAFATTFWVAAILLSLTLIPAWFLPRKREVSHLLDDADAEQVAPPIVLH